MGAMLIFAYLEEILSIAASVLVILACIKYLKNK